MKLFSELRRRNVLRMVVLYLGAAWLLMQVVDVLIDRGPLPESLGPLMLLALAVGFPIALALSWFYEVTPEGVTLDEAARQGAARTASGRGLDFIVISVLAAAVLLFAWDKWWTGPPPGRSVAVLPFADMSVEQDSAYFAAGVSDSVLNMLAQVPDLHVASRTSSFQPRLEGLGTQEIAGLLGVATVLEGSVQRQGNRLRITAQLINAQDDSHLWSRHFDRSDSDIFSIQDEIAEAVTSALETSLQGDVMQRIDREDTDNLAAFEEYSKAMENLRVRTFDSVPEAAQQLERAIELDPDFARAHAMLGYVYTSGRFGAWSELTDKERESRARDAANTALRIAPGMSTALALLGNLTEDRDARAQLYREAVENGPNDSVALRAHTLHLFQVTYETDEAMELAEKLIQLDPLDEKNHWLLAWQQMIQSRIPEALETIARGKEKIPGSVELRDLETFCYWAIGDHSSAIVAKHETLAIDPKEFVNRWAIASDYLAVGMPEEADRWLERAAETAPEQQRDHLQLIRQTVLDIYHQRNDEDVFESLRRWVTEAGNWPFPGQVGVPAILLEYGDRLGRLEEVLDIAESMAPQLFANPPNLEKDLYATFRIGFILLRVGDRQRGELFVRRGLEELDKRSGSNWGNDPSYVAALLALEDTDAALDYFKALDDRARFALGVFGWQFLLHYSPLYDPIREEPEFVALMEELNRNAAEQRRLLEEMADQLPVK